MKKYLILAYLILAYLIYLQKKNVETFLDESEKTKKEITLFNNNEDSKYSVLKRMGQTSISICLPNLFIKYVLDFDKKYDVYKREKYIASILNKFDWYPTLLYSDDNNKILIFKNLKIPVTIKNAPNDLEKQFNNILKDLKSVNIQHNDIKPGEILIDADNKIYLCDFGWASINNNINCGINIWGCINKEKPGGWFNDETALERCNFI